MRNIQIQIATVLLVISQSVTLQAAENSNDFKIRLGMGYDFISQEYFVDSLRYDDPDSAIGLSILSRDYLDDKKAIFYVKYDPDSLGRYFLETGWEQSPHIYRAKGWGHFSLGEYSSRLETDIYLDIKKRYRGETEEGEEATVLNGYLKYRRKFSDRLETGLKISGETVSFDSTGLFVYNYSRLAGEFEISCFTENFNSIYLTGRLEHGYIPDSSELDFDLIRGRIGYFGTLWGSHLVTELSLENKNYQKADSRDDYYLTSFETDLNIPLGGGYVLNPDFEAEYFDFEGEGYFSDDYFQVRSGLILERELGSFTFALGPEIELLEIAADYQNDDDYYDYLISAGLDYLDLERIFIFVENQVGNRIYANDPLYYSDFTFDRFSIIGSAKLYKGLSLDLFLSAEWEWHKISSDDSRLYLFTASLIYSL